MTKFTSDNHEPDKGTAMDIALYVARIAIAATTIVVVAEVSKRYPQYGAVLLSLPLVSILAFVMSWYQHEDLPAISRLARETLVLVPLGLPFFLPFAFASHLGLGFWSSFGAGVVLTVMTIGTWLWFTPAS